jgi:hypothetical protein
LLAAGVRVNATFFMFGTILLLAAALIIFQDPYVKYLRTYQAQRFRYHSQCHTASGTHFHSQNILLSAYRTNHINHLHPEFALIEEWAKHISR